jgi:ATP-dependent helicase HrpA
MTFRVQDDEGRVLAEGKDLDAVRAQLRPRLQAELAAATPSLERRGLKAWTIGALPRVVALPGTGQSVRAYPALVDEGETAGVRVLEDATAQEAAMHAGTRRLLALTIPSPARWVRDKLDMGAQLALAAAPHGSLGALLEDATAAAIDRLVDEAGGPAWDEASFAALRDRVAGSLAETTLAVVSTAAEILDAAREVQRRLDALPPAFADVHDDVAAQLGTLVHPGFLTVTGAARLPDVLRYIRAAARRLERLPAAPAVDRDRMRGVHELEEAHRRRLESWPRGRPLPEPLREVPWLLQELRVSHFAQGLGTRQQVSTKRIRRVLEDTAA